jgi:hypothetical protein
MNGRAASAKSVEIDPNRPFEAPDAAQFRSNSRGAFTMSESAEQMHKRHCSVIAAARFEALSQPYAWQHASKSSPLPANALAAVRDGSAWHALTPGLIASWCFTLQKARTLRASSRGSLESLRKR